MGVSSQAIAAAIVPQSTTTPMQPSTSLETVKQAIVVFHDHTLVDCLTQIPVTPEDALLAMQQLVELIQKLRSPEQNLALHHPLTPETLIPYISDEAYDLLELLQTSPLVRSSQETRPSDPVLIAALIPKLLWCTARSSYPIMQLVEGIQAQVSQASSLWTPGILRLAVILEIRTEDENWCLDLAMGCPPQPLIDQSYQIQTEEGNCLSHVLVDDGVWQEQADQSGVWLNYQLQALTESLLSTTPILQAWMSGLAVDLLIPGHPWRSGELQLKLGLTFTPYESDKLLLTSQSALSNPIEAEFMEETNSEAEGSNSSGYPFHTANAPLMSVAVVEMPMFTLMATTLVRLTDPAALEIFSQLVTQQALAKSINLVYQLELSSSTSESLHQIVRQAYRISALTLHAASSSFCLLQPELLMDELVPKLLWHITRSSYLNMQWISGVPATVLQPDADWKPGILRLVFVLELETSEEQWFVDLATGRLGTDETSRLTSSAIAHIQTSSVFPEPIPVEQLQSQLVYSVQTAAPEIAQLLQGVEMEWLSSSHDWHPGILKLHASLEFVPTIFG